MKTSFLMTSESDLTTRFFFLCAILGLLPSEESASASTSISGSTMGTTYKVEIGDLPQSMRIPEIKIAIERRLETVNDQMSTYRKDSEISRFNRHQGTGWFAVSPATAAVVKRALEIGRGTEGAFDITIGNLVNLWGFGPKAQPVKVPSQKQIDRFRSAPAHRTLKVRLSPPSLKKLKDPRPSHVLMRSSAPPMES